MPVTKLRLTLYNGQRDKGKDQLELVKRLLETDQVESIGRTDYSVNVDNCTYIVQNAKHGYTYQFVRSLFDVNCDCHAHITIEQP